MNTQTNTTKVQTNGPAPAFDPANHQGYELRWPKTNTTRGEAWKRTLTIGRAQGVPDHAWAKAHTDKQWVYRITTPEKFAAKDKHVQDYVTRQGKTLQPDPIEACYKSPPKHITKELSDTHRRRLTTIWPWYIDKTALSCGQISRLTGLKNAQTVRNTLAQAGLASRVGKNHMGRPPSKAAFKGSGDRAPRPAKVAEPAKPTAEGVRNALARAAAERNYAFDRLKVYRSINIQVELTYGDVVLTSGLEHGVKSIQQALDYLNKNGIKVPADQSQLQPLTNGSTYVYPPVEVPVDLTRARMVVSSDGTVGLTSLESDHHYYKAITPTQMHLCKTNNARFKVPSRTKDGIRYVDYTKGLDVAWVGGVW